MSNLSIVIQGNLRPETPAAIRSARACFPNAELVLSTWKGEARLPEFDLCDIILEGEDPGPIATPNVYLRNLLRQTVSTNAGVRKARNEWIVKTRSDLILRDGAILQAFPARLRDRIGAWRNFTADAAVNSALFHVSDLLQIARKSRMLEYWPATLGADVGQSGLLPEQWLFLHFLYLNNEIDRVDPCWLQSGFRQVWVHQRALAKYISILPAGVALLPERLRSDGPGFVERDGDGSLREMFAVYTRMKAREFRVTAGRLKRRLLA